MRAARPVDRGEPRPRRTGGQPPGPDLQPVGGRPPVDPNWALFALPVDQSDADPRVLWTAPMPGGSACSPAPAPTAWRTTSGWPCRRRATRPPPGTSTPSPRASTSRLPRHRLGQRQDRAHSNDFDPSDLCRAEHLRLRLGSALGAGRSASASRRSPPHRGDLPAVPALSPSSTAFMVYDRAGDIGYFEIVARRPRGRS